MQNSRKFTAGNLRAIINIQYSNTLPSVLWRCWLGGRKGIRSVKKTEWWGAGMVICLEQDADLHMARLMPLPLTVSYRERQGGDIIPSIWIENVKARASVKSRLVLPFWYRLTWMVAEKAPINVCVCVCEDWGLVVVHGLLLRSRSLSPSLGVSSLYRLHTTPSPQVKSSPAGYNFQSPGGTTKSFTDHALCMELMESLVPEICLDHIWFESGNIPRLVVFFMPLDQQWNRCIW